MSARVPPPRDPAAHIAASHPRMADLIAKVGPFALQPDGLQSTFVALTRAIVYQQLSGKAASTIHGRVRALFSSGEIDPEGLLALSDERLRGAGLSRGKLLSLRDLAAKTLEGTVPPVDALSSMHDDEIVERLSAVRGIGRWTAEMLLIFRLGRLDVLPVHDFGVRHGFKLVYGKRVMPTPQQLLRLGEPWRPFRTVASWYLWRAVDLHRATKSAGAEASSRKKAAKGAKKKREAG